jgi:hypothetical protein
MTDDYGVTVRSGIEISMLTGLLLGTKSWIDASSQNSFPDKGLSPLNRIVTILGLFGIKGK